MTYDFDLSLFLTFRSCVLMEILRSLSGRMDCFETSLAAIAKHVQAVQVWPALPEPAVSRNLGQQVQAGRQQQQQQQQPAAESGWSRSGSDTVSYRSADYVQSPLRPLPPMDWSAQTSTPVAQSNRFASLATEGVRRIVTMTVTEGRIRWFSEARNVHDSNRSRRLRYLSRSARRPSDLDNSSSSSSSRRPELRQAPCLTLHDIDMQHTVRDVSELVSDRGVRVLSCFEVRPRRRRSDTASPSRKAFRLCIVDKDRDALLVASKWPAYVTVSDGFSKPT